MTTTPSVEDRLRRAFQAVAEQPVVMAGMNGEPLSDARRPPSPRRTGLLVAAVVVLVAAVASVALVYGPRSSAPGSHPPAAGRHGGAVAAFVPTGPTATPRQLSEDAKVLTRRLRSRGDRGAHAEVRGGSVVVFGGTRLGASASTLGASGTLQFRPALCASAPFSEPPAGGAEGSVPTACSSPEYSLQATNLLVTAATGTSNIASIPLDPSLTTVPTSSPAYDESHPADPVLVPLLGDGGERYLLGPAELNGSIVARASAQFQSPLWVVDVDLTSAGAVQWDELAQKYFHEMIGVDLDGQVISLPLTQPSQSSFTSFAGRVQISGSFTRQSAQALAAVLNSGPMATPLTS
jgi:preprotein translocase subunit SecD